MTSKYKPWPILPKEWGDYVSEGVLDDYEGFRILVRGQNPGAPMYRILFDTVFEYQCVEESSCLNDEKRSGGMLGNEWTYIVEDSWMADEFHKISSGILAEFPIKHYALYFKNQFIDVLSEDEPIVENLNE